LAPKEYEVLPSLSDICRLALGVALLLPLA
jgi:hypothetical protein